MEKLFDISSVKGIWTNGFEVATRWQQTARGLWDAQLAASQQASIEAINRSYDLVREAARLADESAKHLRDNLDKAWAHVPGAN
jgi:hypothetical protein